MIIRKAEHLKELGQVIQCPKGEFTSFRFLLRSDGMGYTVTKTVIPKGGPYHWHYKKHLESCFCVSGSGIVKNLDTKEDFYIYPDTLYALDKHDNHTFTALTDTVLICVFNPPLTGQEVHKEDHSYE